MQIMELTKTPGPRVNYLVKQTKKAVLLALMDNGEQIQYWFPKSQCKIRKRDKITIVDNEPVETGEKVLEVVIEDWIWKKREPAKPMGCY